MSPDSPQTAETAEVQITPEMIEAGVSILLRNERSFGLIGEPEEIVAEVWHTLVQLASSGEPSPHGLRGLSV